MLYFFGLLNLKNKMSKIIIVHDLNKLFQTLTKIGFRFAYI